MKFGARNLESEGEREQFNLKRETRGTQTKLLAAKS